MAGAVANLALLIEVVHVVRDSDLIHAVVTSSSRSRP